jgi:hypothetical protein
LLLDSHFLDEQLLGLKDTLDKEIKVDQELLQLVGGQIY